MISQSNRHPALLSGTALAVTLGIAGWSAPAMAQIIGKVDSTSGTLLQPNDTNVADITITQSEAVINWSVTRQPTETTDVSFLPAGNSVTFHDIGSLNGEYTVLNRVFPVDGAGAAINATINLGGTVNSTFGGPRGGNIWFYSPHGIITSGNASFNVGSLLLTTSDIDQSSGSLYLTQAGGNQVGFLPATDPNALIQIGQNTTITASGNFSSSVAGYVGIFAPRIEQSGTVRASGMVGYAAGEAGTITFNAGLVDIAITQGSAESQGNGIVHTGVTGGPSVATTTARQIKMVAMPKNTALTMLLGGSIGFDSLAAVPDGSAVVLSAGWQPGPPPTVQAEIALGRGNATVGNAVITGDSTLFATGTLGITPSATGTGLTRFDGPTQFNVGDSLTMDAAAGTEIAFTSSLTVSPLREGTGEDVRITTAGDPNNLLAPGKIAVASDLFIDATGQTLGAAAGPPNTGADGVGGNVQVSIANGSLTIGGDFSISAHGIGQDGNLAGGSGIAGSIDVSVSGGGSITGAPAVPPATVSPIPVSFNADGTGGVGLTDGSTSGSGTGGVITLSDLGGTLGFGGVILTATGHGATNSVLNPVPGDGLGGQITVTVAGQAQTWDSLSIDASAFDDGGFGSQIGGNAIGNPGGANLQVSGSGALTLGSLTMVNDAVTTTGDGAARTVTAGGLDLRVNALGSLTVTGLTALSASASEPGSNPQVGANLTGGTLTVAVDGTGSKLQLNQFLALADASLAGAGTTAGTAIGGQAIVGATNGGLLQVAGANAFFAVGAVAHVGYGPVTSAITGGTAQLYVQDGRIDATGIALRVSAAAVGDGTSYDGTNVGYSATGGTASVEMLAGGLGAGAITAGSITVNAKGEAVGVFNTDPFSDFTGPFDTTAIRLAEGGGTGQGGTARLQVQSGTLTAGTISVHANGLGGSATYGFSTPFQSGDGNGGQALVTQSGGTITAAALDVISQGQGGQYDGAPFFDQSSPLPGVGRGGTARVTLSAGAMAISGTLKVAALANGGNGSQANGNSASASATAGALADNSLGLAELLMPPGSTATLSALDTFVDASATGGAGANDFQTGLTTNGGAAISGTARISLADGAFDLGLVNVLAGGLGGSGGIGGSSTGGTAAFLLVDTLAAPATLRQTSDVLVMATPSGGSGNVSNGIATPGTTVLTVRAARQTSALVVNGNLQLEDNGIALAGDGVVANFGSVPVQVNGDFTVATTRDINMSVDQGGGIQATGLLSLTGQSITTTGAGVLAAAGSATVLAANSINLGGLSAGTTTLLRTLDPATQALGPVTVQSLSSGGLVTVSGSAVSITSPGSLSFQSASAVGGDLSITTAQALTMASASTTGTASLTAGTELAVNGTLSAPTAIALQAGGNITTAADLTTLGSFSALAGGTYTGALLLNVPGNVSIDAAGGISLPSLSSGGTTFLRAASGAIPLTLTSVGAVTLAARTATIAAPGALAFANATTTAGDLYITTGGALTLGGATSSAVLSLTAPALVSLNGAVAGQTIRISSPDIAIAPTGRLGQRGLTNTILLTNTAPTGGTMIGGTGQQGIWSLDAAEAARLFAEQEIAILPDVTPQTNAGTVTVSTMALTYGAGSTANLAPSARFVVSTPGAILVNGPVALTTSTNGDTLLLSGGTVDVVTDTGGIALTGSGGALLGTLRINGDAVRVGTARALADLSGITDLAAASTRLDANDGLANLAGAIRSGALEVTFSTRFFVQNSGPGTQSDLRRGFAANSLSITTGSATSQIAINGIASGLFGGFTQRTTRINGSLAAPGGLFDPLSTINGCVIGRDCGTTPPGQIVPPQETIAGLVGPLGPSSSLLVLPVIQFGDRPLFDSPPLIDEPVTGVGNDDLWQQR